MSIAVRLTAVEKIYGERAALDNINCIFPQGSVTALIGPNGSGKTTLLRIAAGLLVPDGGEVGYSDSSGELSPGLSLMRRITLVSQRPVMFNTSLRNNLAYGLIKRGMTKSDIKKRVDEALELGGLGRLADTTATRLSGGEMQRAALARAYALRPDAVFLDEPAANLDPDGVAFMESLVRRMNDEGSTVVIITHNLFQARRLAGNVALMYGGRLIEHGAKDDVFERPVHELTRRFLGGEMVY